MAPGVFGIEPNQERIEETVAILQKSMTMLEGHFLKDTKFINSDEISIADLQAFCEFSQFWLTEIDPLEERARLAQWMEDCKKELQPHLDTAHKMLYVGRDRGILKGKL